MRQPGASEARTHDLGITSPAHWPLGYRVKLRFGRFIVTSKVSCLCGPLCTQTMTMAIPNDAKDLHTYHGVLLSLVKVNRWKYGEVTKVTDITVNVSTLVSVRTMTVRCIRTQLHLTGRHRVNDRQVSVSDWLWNNPVLIINHWHSCTNQ